jgi:hypothetical protein
MKRRHDPVIGLFLVVAALMLSAAYGLLTAVQASDREAARLEVKPFVSPIDDSDRQRLVRLAKQVPPLAFPRPTPAHGTPDLDVFGRRQSSDRRAADSKPSAVRRPSPPEFSYIVSMAFTGSRGSYAMVDGSLYAKGDKLPDGGVVAAVESDRVLIAKGGRREWAPVTSWHLSGDAAPLSEEIAGTSGVKGSAPPESAGAAGEKQ